MNSSISYAFSQNHARSTAASTTLEIPPMSRQIPPGSPKRVFRQAPQHIWDSKQQKKPKSEMTLTELKELFPKQTWKPSTLLMPVQAVMLSCGGGKSDFAPNIITVAWAGIVCSDPAMISVSIRKERHSYGIISATKEFIVNIPYASQAKITDWCGMKSGRDVDKFAETRLTPLPATQVKCPLIADCPINIECKVARVVPLGSHDLFIAKILAVNISPDLLDKRGKLSIEQADLLAYAHSEYRTLGKKIGTFGFSVRKRK